MDARDLIIEALGRIQGIVARSLDGITAEQLAYRPTEQANSIAWLTWHLTRIQDRHVSDLAGQPQAWVADGWHAKFGKPADPDDTGQRYTPEQVAEIRPDGPQILQDYHDAVYQRSVAYVRTLTPADLDRELNEPQYTPLPTVGVRLVSVCSDNLQHAGQAVYLRGCIEGQRWHPA
jgi:hypothetical protein